MDFTLTTYHQLLQALKNRGFYFQSFGEYIARPQQRAVVLRHDIDKLPTNALEMAGLEYNLGIKGSYYFRVIPEVWNKEIMQQIVDLGHELGYHYEDLSLHKGDISEAIQHFEKQLARFREIYPVQTICMHGSPLSKHDNRHLWKHYNYRDYGIIGEPYFDVDFDKVFYLTDTGRRWDGDSVSVRDKVTVSKKGFDPGGESAFGAPSSGSVNPATATANEHIERLRFSHTKDIIRAAEQGLLPDQIMITIHPQRWTNKPSPWVKELVWQNIKNIAKGILVKTNKRKTS